MIWNTRISLSIPLCRCKLRHLSILHLQDCLANYNRMPQKRWEIISHLHLLRYLPPLRHLQMSLSIIRDSKGNNSNLVTKTTMTSLRPHRPHRKYSIIWTLITTTANTPSRLPLPPRCPHPPYRSHLPSLTSRRTTALSSRLAPLRGRSDGPFRCRTIKEEIYNRITTLYTISQS